MRVELPTDSFKYTATSGTASACCLGTTVATKDSAPYGLAIIKQLETPSLQSQRIKLQAERGPLSSYYSQQPTPSKLQSCGLQPPALLLVAFACG